jgi:hypothetical protein
LVFFNTAAIKIKIIKGDCSFLEKIKKLSVFVKKNITHWLIRFTAHGTAVVVVC